MQNQSPFIVPVAVAHVPPVMTIQEAADVARLSRGYLYKEIQAGRLRTVKQHKRRLVLGDDLLAYLRNSLVTGTGTQPEAA
jgi:excisionase family DNA binding protein